MFFRKNAKEPPKKSAATAPAPAAAPSMKRTGRSAAPSIISSDLIVKGSLTSAGDMQIDSRVEGDVRSSGLVLGSNAVIEGDVVADDITVRGRVLGDIHAGSVMLGSGCHIRGNILYRTLSVEHGANIEGNCRTADDPVSQANGTNKLSTPGGMRRNP